MSLTYEEALDKLQRYCVYQDRCHQEVRTKLLELKVYGDKLEEVMSALIEENFLNEERFARSYVRGKYKIKRWGKSKILLELKRRKISAYCIKKGMSEIEEDVYLENIQYSLRKYAMQYAKNQDYVRRQKILQACQRRGYTIAECMPHIDKIIEQL